jgi:anti-anti-sigma regulatory factor
MTSSAELDADDPTDFDVYVDHLARRVEIVGDLDIVTTPFMVDAAMSLQTDPPRDITIDLDCVTFVDVGALAALVGLSNIQLDHGVLLHIIAPVPVKRAAAMCGLDLNPGV